MKPQVSIILPVYNAQDTLKQAVASILTQTFTAFELLIIDDGSTDSSKSIIKEFNDPRLSLHSNSHSGLSESLNYGINQASGKYIIRMDADDISMQNRLDLQIQYMDRNPETDVLASNVRFKGPSGAEGIRHYVNWQNQLLNHSDIYLNRFVDCPLVHPSIIVRRSSFNKFGYYEQTNGPEDFELWLRWLDQGAVFHKLKDELLVWIDSPTRLTRINDNYQKDKFFDLKARYFSRWFTNNFHRGSENLWIIGAGSAVFQRCRFIEKYGLTIQGYIDFKPNPSASRTVIGYNDIPSLKNPFFLSYVGDRNGRKKIKDFLIEAGFIEGVDFYMMA